MQREKEKYTGEVRKKGKETSRHLAGKLHYRNRYRKQKSLMKQTEMKVKGHQGHEKEALWLQSGHCLPGGGTAEKSMSPWVGGTGETPGDAGKRLPPQLSTHQSASGICILFPP